MQPSLPTEQVGGRIQPEQRKNDDETRGSTIAVDNTAECPFPNALHGDEWLLTSSVSDWTSSFGDRPMEPLKSDDAFLSNETAWNADFLDQHFDTKQDYKESATTVSAFRGITTNRSSLPNLHLHRLDEDDNNSTSDVEKGGKAIHEPVTDAQVSSWPFDTSLRVIAIRGDNKIGTRSEYIDSSNSRIDQSHHEALFSNDFSTSMACMDETTTESSNVPVEALSHEGRAANETTAEARVSSWDDAAEAVTPKTTCYQHARTFKPTIARTTGILSQDESHTAVATTSSADMVALSDTHEQSCSDAFNDCAGANDTSDSDDPQSAGQVGALDTTTTNDRTLCKTSQVASLHGANESSGQIQSTQQDHSDCDTTAIFGNASSSAAAAAAAIASSDCESYKSCTPTSTSLSPSRNLRDLLRDKEATTSADFEQRQNRQLLHQLVYKHKMGLSLKALRETLDNNPDEAS